MRQRVRDAINDLIGDAEDIRRRQIDQHHEAARRIVRTISGDPELEAHLSAARERLEELT